MVIYFLLSLLVTAGLPWINHAFSTSFLAVERFEICAATRHIQNRFDFVSLPVSKASKSVLLSSENANGNDADDQNNTNSEGSSIFDWAKKAIEVEENLVRSVTGNQDYKFGDITKNVTKSAVEAEENLVKSVTGYQDYKFGDITKKTLGEVNNLLFESDTALLKFVDDYYMSVKSGSVKEAIRDVSNERKSAMITTLQLIAFVGLTLHSVLNFCHSWGIITAWGITCFRNAGASPMQSSALWAAFLRYQQSIRIFIGPILLPAQVGATFFLGVKYRNAVIWIEDRIPTPKDGPVFNRCLALAIAWLFGNCLGFAFFTYLGCSVVGWLGRIFAI